MAHFETAQDCPHRALGDLMNEDEASGVDRRSKLVNSCR